MTQMCLHKFSLSLSLLQCRHGDMLYLQESSSGLGSEVMETDAGEPDTVKSQEVEENEVDKVLSKADGRIVREKDPQL